MPIGLIVALVLAVGGGVSVVAQRSVPGDALYGVKVNINEEARAAFALSSASKAEVDADRAGERLEEAEELSVEAQVGAEVQADIEGNFKEFADRTEARINALIDTDARAAADIASSFEAALNAHTRILARLAARTDGAEVRDLQASVDKELKETVALRVKAEAKVKTEDGAPATIEAARGKLSAAANVLVEVDRYIDLKESQLGASAVANARAELKKAEDIKVQGDADFAAGDYPAAFIKGNAVIRMAQGAKLLIEAQEHLEVDLNLGGKPSTTPPPHPSPKIEGAAESEEHAEGNGASVSGRVNIEFGF
jgi:hypothetical protein